jgi:hypothetical protein
VDLLSNKAGRHRKLLPKRTHSKDIYDRLATDVFVNIGNVEEMIRAEGFAAYLGGSLDGVMDTRQTLQ